MVKERDRQLWQNYLFSASRILAQAEAQMQADANMSLSDFDVLITLYRNLEENLSMSCLKATVLVTTSGLSRSVSRLERHGWVMKIPNEQDKRQVYLTLTDEGKEVVVQARKKHAEVIQRIFFDALSEKDLEGMSRGLAHLADHLR